MWGDGSGEQWDIMGGDEHGLHSLARGALEHQAGQKNRDL